MYIHMRGAAARGEFYYAPLFARPRGISLLYELFARGGNAKPLSKVGRPPPPAATRRGRRGRKSSRADPPRERDCAHSPRVGAERERARQGAQCTSLSISDQRPGELARPLGRGCARPCGPRRYDARLCYAQVLYCRVPEERYWRSIIRQDGYGNLRSSWTLGLMYLALFIIVKRP